ncbi:hypothetical protein C4Q28_15810 [Pseudomonas sp. SWI6]|nr:hypothetical protein C4Q28_15810 [Pseudomonas sp. SWI6]AVD85676.1 hypothetical protein C4Q26_00255 [Pseudomonas sp. SWI44]
MSPLFLLVTARLAAFARRDKGPDVAIDIGSRGVAKWRAIADGKCEGRASEQVRIARRLECA